MANSIAYVLTAWLFVVTLIFIPWIYDTSAKEGVTIEYVWRKHKEASIAFTLAYIIPTVLAFGLLLRNRRPQREVQF